jgi:hypothetical protein
VSHKAELQPDDSTSVYTVPYIIDTATASSTPIGAGIRIHWPVIQASLQNIQMVRDFKNSLTLGSKGLVVLPSVDDEEEEHHHSSASGNKSPKIVPYKVRNDGKPLSPLGVTLEWGADAGISRERNDNSHNNTTTTRTRRYLSSQKSPNVNLSSETMMMTTHIIRGMPYATMVYQGGLLPSIYSYNGLGNGGIRIDDDENNGKVGNKNVTLMKCDKNESTTTYHVKRHLHMHFINSDFTWMVFFSRPVQVQCQLSDGDPFIRDFQLDVVKYDHGNEEDPLVVRVALLSQCTTGKSNIQQHCGQGDPNSQWNDIQGYEQLLKDHAHIYPTNPQMDFPFNINSTGNDNENINTTDISIDWGAKTFGAATLNNDGVKEGELLMFALPHHQDSLSVEEIGEAGKTTKITNHCTNTFHGPTCLIEGASWTLSQQVGDMPLSFWAPRPPEPDMIPTLAEALAKDIQYRLSNNLLRGAADTYFSGKILARYARVVVIADELKQLANNDISTQQLLRHYSDENVNSETLQIVRKAAASVHLPSASLMASAVEHLKLGVQAWLDSDAEAPFVYDSTWGGLVNCGCRYVGNGERGYCNNTFPDCPALASVNEDFGNGKWVEGESTLWHHCTTSHSCILTFSLPSCFPRLLQRPSLPLWLSLVCCSRGRQVRSLVGTTIHG